MADELALRSTEVYTLVAFWDLLFKPFLAYALLVISAPCLLVRAFLGLARRFLARRFSRLRPCCRATTGSYAGLCLHRESEPIVAELGHATLLPCAEEVLLSAVALA